jgi:cell wall-associated NlpC family hydrolase
MGALIRRPGQAPYVLAVICAAALAAAAAVPALADPSISSKRAEAEQVMSRLQQLSDQLEQARSRYDAASARLARIQRSLNENRHALHVAKHNLKRSRSVIAHRLVTLYTTEPTSTIEVVLGARSLDDMLDELDNARSVTSLDARVLRQVRTYRSAVQRNGVALKQAHRAQRQVVAERRAARDSIEAKVGEENRLYASIEGEIKKLVAEEHERQLAAVRRAQARLSAARSAAADQSRDTIVGVSAITPENDTAIAPPSTHTGVVGVALTQLGQPYVWGGAQPGGFDCSGFVMWAYAQVGVSLPHSTYAQFALGVPVSRDQLEPGDLVFFDGVGHVGIYIGGDQFVQAPHTGDVVKISSLSEGWYAATYVGARRIL